jgi:hypothetical protein
MRTVVDRVQNRRCLLCYLSLDICIDGLYSRECLTQDSQRIKVDSSVYIIQCGES